MSTFNDIRKIDNTRGSIPWITIICIAFLILIAVWFLRGGSFRLYASLFFGLYSFTKSAWISIMLVAVIQNIFFLPFRVLYERYYFDLKKFEHQLKTTNVDDQYFLLNRNVREGNASVLFYTINFVLLFIAFISAGRVFLLEFYRTPISRNYLYSFIPYPQYPLQGVIFHFPFIAITKTTAVSWQPIIYFWLAVLVITVALRLLWRLIRPVLSRNQTLLRARIGYNHLVLIISGFAGTFMIVSTIILRHFPVAAHFYYLVADLSYQNTTFNIITASATFFAALYSGYNHNKEEAAEARKIGIPETIIAKVTNDNTRLSLRNGILLGIFAFWVTRLMPCSHDLSVLSFEACYVLSPVTFDLIIPKSKHRAA